MAPLPEEADRTAPAPTPKPPPGHEVVISGISGKFPESGSVRDLMRNLYDKVDMISDDDRRWAVDHPDIPRATGKIGGIERFDAQFFGVHYKQAWCMDPLGRLLLENTFGAVIDAGMNPRELRKSNTAVCVGAATSDAEKMWYFDKTQVSGFGLTGTARSKLPNRISYWLGTQGPSFLVNTTCSSGLHVLQLAYASIRSGQCDAAVVAACNLCAHPFISLLFNRFPSDPIRHEAWYRLIRLERDDVFYKPRKYAKVCSAHFQEDDFISTLIGLQKLKSCGIKMRDILRNN